MITKFIRPLAVAMATMATMSCAEDDGIEQVTLGTTSWHDGFLWSDADTTGFTKKLSIEFNDDAMRKGASVSLAVTDNDGKPVPESQLEVIIDGRRARGNVIEVAPVGGKKTREAEVSFRFMPEAEDGKHQGYLVIRPHGIACVNDTEATDGARLMQWTINFNKGMNPLAKGLLTALCMAAGVVIMARMVLHRRKFGPTARKSVVATDASGRIIYGPKTVRMGGCSEVVLCSREIKQGWLSAFFTGRTICVTSAAFSAPLRLKPGRRGRKEIKVAGGGYSLSASKMAYSDTPLTATDNSTKNKIQLS